MFEYTHVDAVDQPPWTDTRLRDVLMTTLTGMEPLDLSAVLSGRVDAFLTADYHLSPTGHELVARAIETRVGDE